MTTPQKTALANITGFEICNIAKYENTTICGTPFPRRCSLWVSVLKEPNFVYHDLGRSLVAYDEGTGLASAFSYKWGSSGGFADRGMVIPIVGGVVFKKKGITKKEFKGSLWDSSECYTDCEDFFNIQLTGTAYRKHSDNGCYVSAQINSKILSDKMRMAGLSMGFLGGTRWPNRQTPPKVGE